jgi:hypothetical protein
MKSRLVHPKTSALLPITDFWWVIAKLEPDDDGPSLAQQPWSLIAERFLHEEVTPAFDSLHGTSVYLAQEHALLMCACEKTTVQQYRDDGYQHFGPAGVPQDDFSPRDGSQHRALNLLTGEFEPLLRGRSRRMLAQGLWALAAGLGLMLVTHLESRRSVLQAQTGDHASIASFAQQLSKTASIEALASRQPGWQRTQMIERELARGDAMQTLSLLASLASHDTGQKQPGVIAAWHAHVQRVMVTLTSPDDSVMQSVREQITQWPGWQISQTSREARSNHTPRLHLTLQRQVVENYGRQSLELAQKEAP